MTTKKARKRAYIPPSHEVANRKPRTAGGTGARPARAQRTSARSGYVHPTPSIGRTLKRLPIYFLLVFGLQFYLLNDSNPERSAAQIALFAASQAAIVTLVLAPFMHVMDKASYNRWRKKHGGTDAPAK